MVKLVGSVLVVALLAQGCSFVMTHGAPSTLDPQRPPDCTTSKGAVFLDGTIAGAAVGTALLLGIAALAKQADIGDGETNDLAYATLYTFLGGVAFSVSGVVGGARVRSCRRANDTWKSTYAQPPAPYAPAATFGPPGATAPQ